jgi:ABC-2 type transport system permease protein
VRLGRPGSTLWLLGYELRLAWRGAAGQGRRRGVVAVIFGLVLLIVGLPLGLMLARQPLAATTATVVMLDLALLVVATLMLSMALGAALQAFQARGDLDLLLSSPLSGRKVLAARVGAIAGGAFLAWAGLATPFLLPVAVLGHPAWLAAYPTLAAMALACACGGVGLAMALFRLIGPRAARTVGQVLAALIGAAVYLASQSFRLFPSVGRSAAAWVQAAANAGLFAPLSPLSWPARAMIGEPWPLAALIALALAAFALTARALGRRFVADAALSAGIGSRVPVGPERAGKGRFAGSTFHAVTRKEWRLLLRDPALISQVLMRVLYLAPLCAVMLARSARHDAFAAAAVAGPVALMAGQVAGALAWITLSAEDAPDLIAASPARALVVRRAKLAAALQPTAVLLAAPLIGLTVLSPRIGLAAAGGSAAAAVSAALVNLWLGKPAPRQAFNRRPGGSAAMFAELAIGIGWALTTGLAALGSLWALVPAVLTLLGLGALNVVAEPDRAA